MHGDGSSWSTSRAIRHLDDTDGLATATPRQGRSDRDCVGADGRRSRYRPCRSGRRAAVWWFALEVMLSLGACGPRHLGTVGSRGHGRTTKCPQRWPIWFEARWQSHHHRCRHFQSRPGAPESLASSAIWVLIYRRRSPLHGGRSDVVQPPPRCAHRTVCVVGVDGMTAMAADLLAHPDRESELTHALAAMRSRFLHGPRRWRVAQKFGEKSVLPITSSFRNRCCDLFRLLSVSVTNRAEQEAFSQDGRT